MADFTLSFTAAQIDEAVGSARANRATLLSYDQTVPNIDRGDNVASVTDVGAGKFLISFTNNHVDALYVMTGSGFGQAQSSRGGDLVNVDFDQGGTLDNRATNQCPICTMGASNAAADANAADRENAQIAITGPFA